MNFLADPTPHTQAVTFIKGLPTVDRDTFNRLPDEFKQAAFMITAIKAHDVLQDVRDMIAKIPEGEDFEATRQRVAKRIAPSLGGNDKAALALAGTVTRYYTNRSYNLGIHLQLENHKGAFPFRKRLATHINTRPSHEALSDTILPADSPAWDWLTPPGPGLGCQCFIVGVTRRAMQRAQAEDDAAVAAGTLDPAKRRVLDGPQLAQLVNARILTRGPNEQFNYTGEITWNPNTLLMPVDDIRKRYDSTVWGSFEKLAKAHKPDGKQTLWDALHQQPRSASTASAPQPPAAPQPVQPSPPQPAQPGGPGAPAPAAPQPAPAPAPPQPSAAPPAVPAPVSPISPVSTAPAAQVAAHVQLKAARSPNAIAVNKAAKEALDAIAKVHSDGGLKQSPLQSKVMKTANGMYSRASTVARRLADPFDFDSSIEINPKSPHPVVTMLHETGHKIDMEAIANGTAVRHPAAHAERQKVVAALKTTARAAAIQSEPQLRYAFKLYALSDEELFARAYAQYIAVRSGNATALGEIAADMGHPVKSLLQWPDAEFAPILPLFDQLFTALGWAK